MNIIKKITAKNIMGKPIKKCNFGELFSIIGIVKETFVKETEYGQSLGLMGEFKAKNLENNAEFRASKAFLPDIVTDMIAINFSEDSQDDLEFGMIITKIENESSTVGFIYGLKPLLELKSNNALNLLEEKINSKNKSDKKSENKSNKQNGKK